MIAETLALISEQTPEWMRWAQCADADPALFHTEPGEVNTERIEIAKKICAHCPVRLQCLIWSFKIDDHFAILGGKTPHQRSRIARRMRQLEGEEDLLEALSA